MPKAIQPKSNSKKSVKWIRYAILAMVAIGIYHIMSGPSGTLNLFKLRSANAKLAHELDSLTLRKQSLITEKARLETDSAYLERVARKDLGMAKPTEKVFRFVKPE